MGDAVEYTPASSNIILDLLSENIEFETTSRKLLELLKPSKAERKLYFHTNSVLKVASNLGAPGGRQVCNGTL